MFPRTEPALALAPTDGWEPICEALGLPIPEIPFPNTNSISEFVGRR